MNDKGNDAVSNSIFKYWIMIILIFSITGSVFISSGYIKLENIQNDKDLDLLHTIKHAYQKAGDQNLNRLSFFAKHLEGDFKDKTGKTVYVSYKKGVRMLGDGIDTVIFIRNADNTFAEFNINRMIKSIDEIGDVSKYISHQKNVSLEDIASLREYYNKDIRDAVYEKEAKVAVSYASTYSGYCKNSHCNFLFYKEFGHVINDISQKSSIRPSKIVDIIDDKIKTLEKP